MREEIKSVDSLVVERSLFQMTDGGSIPTSTHQLELRLINKNLAWECYKKWHYLGETGFIATKNFGVYYNGHLYGCISFGAPNATELKGYFDRHSQKGWWEIKRLALSDSLPKNSESRVIAIALRLLAKTEDVVGVITYADDGLGHTGTIYRASGFKYLGMTAAKNDFWVEGKIQQRGKTAGKKGEWKPRSRKHLFIKAPNINNLKPLQ